MKSFTAFAALTLLASAAAETYYVDPATDDFEECLKMVVPGDTCYLLEGDHKHDGLTRTHGTADARITITGDKEACIKGSNTQDRALQIAHDFYTIENICFDGKHGSEYVATAVYVLGEEYASKRDESYGLLSSVTGLQMFNLDIRNFDEECVHLRYMVTFSEISGCLIQDCGKHSFSGGSGVVGEGIYVGTAVSQVDDGKAPEVKLRSGSADNVDYDVCQKNWIHENTIRTYANECVDIKEGSTNNLVEKNICEQQFDENSGCFGSRGNDNTFRFNDITGCVGAGVRVGGADGYGILNNIYGNSIADCSYGAFNVMAEPQGKVCGNSVSVIDVVTQGSEKSTFKTDIVTGDCTDDDTPGDIPEFGGSSPSPTPDSVDPAPSPTPDPVASASASASASADEDSRDAVPLTEEEDDGECAGVNCVDEEATNEIPEEDKIVEIETNSNAGGSGNGECDMVLGVAKFKAEHYDNRDPTTEADSLFDGDLDTYFSVNRESTEFIMELEQETEVHGISIGFFMKDASAMRIQTFDVAVRAYDEEDYTTMISRKESSGAMGDVQFFEFTSPVKAQYVKLESHGNTENRWTAFTEVEICGVAAESNALFGGVRAAKKEIAELAGEVCIEPVLLAPVWSSATGQDNIKEIFDGNFETRWSTQVTQASNDLDNAKIMLKFVGDVHVSYVDIAFFDGHLAKQHFSLYKQSASERSWTPIVQGQMASKTEAFQSFDLQETGVNVLSIVGNGNDVGFYTKISEVKVYGC